MTEFTGTLVLDRDDCETLWLALGTKAFIMKSQGYSTGRIKSLQGRVDTVWAMLQHAEKVRDGETREEIFGTDAVERLAAESCVESDV